MKTYSELTETEIEEHLKTIACMDHYALAQLHRFAPAGHPYFDSSGRLYPAFKARFDSLGGMTPEISKQVGW